MKLRKLLIPAVILTALGFVVKLCDTLLNVNGTGFFLNSDVCNITVACSFMLLFVIGFALSIADRKKQFVSEPSKNVACGVFGFIASIMLIGGGVVQLLSWNGANIVENILAIAAGFVVLYESCISFTGSNGMKKIPVVALIVPIWSVMRFVSLFIDYTTKSLKAVELFDIVEVAFLMLFLYYQSMYFAGVNNKLAARRLPVYGSVFIMLGLIVSTDLFIKMFTGTNEVTNVDTQIVLPTITNIMTLVGDLAFCVYAFLLIRDTINHAEKSLTAAPAEGDDNGKDMDDAAAPAGTPDATVEFSMTEIDQEPVKSADDDKADDKPEESADGDKAEDKPEESADGDKAEDKPEEPVDENKAEDKPEEPVDENKAEDKPEEPVDENKAENKPEKTEEKNETKSKDKSASGEYNELLDMLDKM